MESSEEVYSRSIIKNILEELSEDIHTKNDYGSGELFLEAELEVYKRAFPTLDMDTVEMIVREYLYNHNYLEYSRLLEGSVEYSLDDEFDVLFVSCSDDIGEDIDVSLDVDGWVVDVDKGGFVRGLELVGWGDFLRLKDDELVEWCVVTGDYGRGLVDLRVSFYIVREGEEYGRLCQWFGSFAREVCEDYIGLRCVYR